MIKDDLTLAFDTVVSSGDVSISRNDEKIASIDGDIEASSSETLLTSISRILNDSQVAKTNITLCALTVGPGSYTGIRIGIATALGLSRSIGCKVYGVSSLELLAHAGNQKGKVVSGVWAGRNEIVYQKFTGEGLPEGEMELMTVEKFFSKYNSGSREIILDRKSHDAVEQLKKASMENFKTAPGNIASLLAVTVKRKNMNFQQGRLTPIYSRSLFDR